MHATPSVSHSGEVSGFLAMNTLFPSKDSGIVVLTNEDGVNLIGPLTQQIAGMLVDPENASAEKLDQQVRSILEGLQTGQIDRSLFTDNANSYFNDLALADYRTSLAGLGKLQILSRTASQGRGGMTYIGYRAHFEKNTVLLSIYVRPDGKFEQFLVEEQF
jgi:hypothetical protein